MILIVGGSCQGKLTFAGTFLADKELREGGVRIADGRSDRVEDAFAADIVNHAECYIRRLLATGEPPEVFVERLIKENPDVLVIADEIGYGIVSVSAFEREYRETDGRLCQRLAAASSQVYRVICGIGTKIKG